MSDLTLSRDRKVAPMGIWQAKEQRWIPRIRNSFGLPSGKTCPGRTPWCKDICYGANAERGYTGVGDALQRNLDALLQAGTVEAMSELLVNMVGKFASAADRWQLPPADRVFRIHWDGDFFSLDYANAWALTIARYPSISFWAYTRAAGGDLSRERWAYGPDERRPWSMRRLPAVHRGPRGCPVRHQAA